MKKEIYGRVIFPLTVLISLIAGRALFFIPKTKVSGQRASRGWRVWVKTSSCSGRADWISVAQQNPGEGGTGFYQTADIIQSPLKCRLPSPNGCTFDEATAEAAVVRASNKFSGYCCRSYSVWENTQTKEISIVSGKGSAGYGSRLVKGDLCCEEAEAVSGKPGLCSGNTGGGKSGYIGCFKDTSAFDLDGFLERSDDNTPERCVAACRAKGFQYAAVQYGQSCLCGNSYGKYGAADNCNMKCTGDSSKICGGYSANSVYGTSGGDDLTTDDVDLSGTWYNTFYVNGRWDHTMILSRAGAGKWSGTR